MLNTSIGIGIRSGGISNSRGWITQLSLKYEGIQDGRLIEVKSGNNLHAAIHSPTGSTFNGSNSYITVPPITELNAVGLFSIYIKGTLTSITGGRTIFDRLGTSSTWLQTIITDGQLIVDVKGITSRWGFGNIITTGNIELLILFNGISAKATRVVCIYNGSLYYPTTLPSGDATDVTGSITGGTDTIGYSSNTWAGILEKFGLWNKVISLSDARIAGDSPVLYYADCFSGIDISGNGNHATEFNNIVKSRTTNGWHKDYGYTLYSDGGLNNIWIPYSTNKAPIISTPTHIRGGVTYNKISEKLGGTIYGDEDILLDFNPSNSLLDILYPFRRNDTSICTSTARSGHYNASRPSEFHLSELNRESLTAFYNVPHLFNLFPIFNGNSVDERDYLIEIDVFKPDILTSSKVQQRLKYTKEIGKVTIPDMLMGYEGASILYEDNEYVDYIISTFRWEAVRGNKVFAHKNKAIFISNNNGDTWDSIAVVPTMVFSLGQITNAYIWGNGNIEFYTKEQKYLASSNLSVVSLKTVYESDGITPKTIDGTGQLFYNILPCEKPQYVEGQEIYCFLNYGNNHTDYADNNIYYSTNNGEITKVAYKWGKNPDHGNLGNVDNPFVIKHGHGITQHKDGYFIAYTGDEKTSIGTGGINECHIIKGEYNHILDTWAWVVLQSGDGTTTNWKWSGAEFDNNYIHWISDNVASGLQGVYKCDDLLTPGAITKIATLREACTGMIDIESLTYLISFAAGYASKDLIISTDNSMFNQTTLASLPENSVLFRGRKKNNNGWYLFDLFFYPPSYDAAPVGSVVLIKPK